MWVRSYLSTTARLPHTEAYGVRIAVTSVLAMSDLAVFSGPNRGGVIIIATDGSPTFDGKAPQYAHVNQL